MQRRSQNNNITCCFKRIKISIGNFKVNKSQLFISGIERFMLVIKSFMVVI